MKLEDFMPFVGSYSGKVDYILEDETKRMKVTEDSYAGDLFIEISIQNSLPQHIYGIVWNPPKKTR
jgi:hypothetical protein